ncbi:hypothetical protein BX616_011058 [Lobosporangium transversale]|uniref:Microbial-type PARG catalytic domain-containing protein n=1 Tax=Lobosporangium transversale TaxID=64571 RepID=A0A1Y2GMN1_9FUNG|nr:hypothetical protein BCR41DRAFT_354085 [Lobosporangium transversale]KAF9917863.1 hypothetical protein BX616_011058 [Lobosporangium transversale]ORZ15566.1 hypothetical protein BCR41DRAFT_354085 [Lobosporangium transversale]|eukprot:XP_021881314.1 hypothetical protein BCR41DRAFT_354085 [Lobosporangium transversale]
MSKSSYSMPPGEERHYNVPTSRPNSMQQKLALMQQQQQQYNVKPITIRPNSMSLPFAGLSHQQTQSKLSQWLHFGQQKFLKLKRLHRIRTRRGLERNWYQVSTALFLILSLLLLTHLLGSIIGFGFSFGSLPLFSGSRDRLGPRMKETLQALEELQYMTNSGVIVTLDKNKLYSGVRRARLYQGSRIRRQIMDFQKDPVIKVVDNDCLDEALKLKRLGFKPIVLDMANREFPGGDYRADGTTQEAGLFRRTNLHQCLDTEPRRSEFYPLPSQGAVYCPNMVVLRRSIKDNEAFMERPEWMSFLAMAPLRNPPLVPNEANEMVLGERAVIITKKKIQNMFRIALDNGHDAIVLSAFGCGRLHNPPESVAMIFKEVIKTNYMGGAKQGRTFGTIVFAITSYKSLDSDVSDTYNYDTFKRVMEAPDEIPPTSKEMEL